MDRLEELRQQRAGKPWLPANGSEFDGFYEGYCERCKHESEDIVCEVIKLSMFHEIGEPEYPKEWIYSSDGWPTCTKFEEVT